MIAEARAPEMAAGFRRHGWPRRRRHRPDRGSLLGWGGDEFDLVAVLVFQVGGVMLLTARVGVKVGEHQPPAVTQRPGDQVLHTVAGGDVEGQVVEAGAAPVVTERGTGR